MVWLVELILEDIFNSLLMV